MAIGVGTCFDLHLNSLDRMGENMGASGGVLLKDIGNVEWGNVTDDGVTMCVCCERSRERGMVDKESNIPSVGVNKEPMKVSFEYMMMIGSSE